MRNKSLFLLSIFIVTVFSLVSIPPANAQAVPTIIYDALGFEIDPAVLNAGSPGSYGNVGGQEWDDSCGVDGSACLYEASTVDNGNPFFTQVYRILNYFEQYGPTVTGQTWEPCVINYVEFDLYYFVPPQVTYTDQSLFTMVTSTDTLASIASVTQPDHYDYRLDVEFAELPDNVQGDWFHVSLPLENTEVMESFAIRWLALESDEDNTGIDPDREAFELRIDNLVVWCDYADQLIRPLTLDDEHPQWELFDPAYVEGIDPDIYDTLHYWTYGFSQGFHAPVHSASAGVVDSIEPFTGDKCEQNMMQILVTELFGEVPQCYIFIPNVITNDANELYRLDLINAYLVVVDVGDERIEYIVANAPDYIEEGMEINGGCVLGETIQLLRAVQAEITTVEAGLSAGTGGVSAGFGGSAAPVSTLTNNGWVGERLFIADVDERIYPKLTRYPTSDAPCGSNPQFANCLEDDPELRQASAWQTQGNVTFDNPGFTLVTSNALIKEVMALESDVEYGLTVVFEVLEPEPRVELKLGQTVEPHTILESPGSLVTLSIAADLHAADLTEFWTVRIRNVSNASVKIVSVCVSSGDIVGQPTACYFRNDSFDQGVANWDVSEGVEQRDGSITVPSLDTFAQEATLPADEPDTTFQLYVEVYIWYEPGTTISRTDYTSTVQLEYQFPDSGASWVTLVGPSSGSTTTFSEFVLAAERSGVTVGTVSFQGFIEIDADTTGTITIRPTVDTEVEGVLGVGIDRACLRGDFGVDQIDDTLGIECQAVTRPLDQLLSSWTVWLWRQFDRFFQCDMMIVMRQIRNTTTEIYRLSGWSIRYWKALGFYQADWMATQLFPWFNGHFNNIASNGGVFYINNQPSAATNLWDFLIAILQYVIYPIINAAAALLGLIISGVFGLMAIFLVQVFGIISQIIDIIGALIAGWQGATPIPIPGFPTCETDPTTNIMCVPLYILGNTIFAPGGPGEIMLGLIVAWGSLELILWVVASIRQGLMEATNSA